jgi:multidrug efflux pump subunit AcrB
MANVFIPFPGAAVKDVESLVTTPAEQVLSQITGIEHIYSVSRPGLAVLTVQFKVGEDRIQALVRLYDTLHANRDWVPRELGVGEFIVKPKGIDDVPIVALTFWTDDPGRGAYELRQVATAAEIELKRIAGTRTVTTIGGAPRAVRVLLDIGRMNAYGVTAQDVRGALLDANVALPSGKLTRENREIEVETGGFLASAPEIGALVVARTEGRPVYLSDVARIEDGPQLPDQYVRHGVREGGAEHREFPAVTLAVTKKPGENAVDIAERVITRVDDLRGSIIPEGVHVAVSRNYGATANDKAQQLIQKLIFATLSVIALVLATLGQREAVIVGAAVLLTLAATLFASWAWGFTLNRVSLFALIFSIGILVDDAIVVVENIHRRRALSDAPLIELIPAAVDEVGGPTILATLTVIAALLPMAFVTGLMGPYMSPIPINASIGMLISLAVAFVVTPWLALKLAPRHYVAHAEAPAGGGRMQRLFERLLSPFLAGRRGRVRRGLLAAGVLAAIVLAVSLAAFKLVVLKMLPFDNKSEFQLVVDLPAGTALEETARVLQEIAAYVVTVPEVTDYQIYAGAAAPINFNGLVRQYYLRQGPEVGDIQVNLLDKHKRSRSSHDIARSARPEIERIARRSNARVKVVEVPPGPPVLAPIVAEVYGPDYAGQVAVARQLRATFAATSGIVDVDDSTKTDAAKVVLQVDRSKAAQLGITQREIADAVRLALGGDGVTPFFTGTAKFEVPIRVGIPPAEQTGLGHLLQLRVRAASGALIPLSELVRPLATVRDQAIYHKDLAPVVYVVGDMAGTLDSPLYGMFAIRSAAVGASLPQGGTLGEYFVQPPPDRYAGYALKWDGEWQVTYETFRDMGIAYAVGLILIYLLVVAEFRSYVAPLVIMAPIPLTVIGVMPGHALLGAQFTATSMIGMIALAGIIVRNSILLVDFVNLELARGVRFEDAIVRAGATRAKPIVLTGIAAMLGALFILDDPIFNGLAVTLLFGILVSTLLTLIVIPVLYYAANWRRIQTASTQ